MKFKLLTILFLLLLTTSTFAYNIEELQEKYNQNLPQVPGFVKKLIGNEVINLYYTRLSGRQEIMGIKTYKARIIGVSKTPYEKPTMNIYTSEDTAQLLAEKRITIQQALKSGRIRYKSLRFKTKFKTFLFKPILRIWGWFT